MRFRRHSHAGAASLFLALAVGLLATAATALGAEPATPNPFEIQSFTNTTTDAAEADYTLAGGHPYLNTTDFSFVRNSSGEVPESAKDAFVALPNGFVGNPSVAPRCAIEKVKDPLVGENSECPSGSQVGIVFIESGIVNDFRPLYNLIPEKGFPAQFGFTVVHVPTVLSVVPLPRTDSYGLSVGTANIPHIGLARFQVSYFGVPSEHGSGSTEAPFLSNPLDCSDAQPIWSLTADSYQHSGLYLPSGLADLASPNWRAATTPAVPVTGCEDSALTSQFDPSLETKALQPGGGPVRADQPTGLAVDLDFPQSNDPTDPNTTFDPEVPQAPEPKQITVKLPPGLAISPSSADGLEACSDLASDPAGDQVHYDSTKPVTCPEASKIGTAVAISPLLALRDPIDEHIIGPEPIDGSVYLLKPHPGDLPIGGGNQAGKFRLLIQLENERYGVNIKLPGVATADPNTGQLTATFTENPQLPSSHITVSLKEGSRAPLASPTGCGSFETTSDLVPWSSPGTPDAHPTAKFAVTQGPNGTACPASPAARPFAPTMSAGSESAKAGATSPFTLHIARADGEQELSSLEATLPKGLAAKFIGVPYCSEAALATAATRSGQAEQANPTCPASRIGSVTVGAGPGSDPFYAQGSAYLAGPYKGAPMSVAVITPAVAGPFDLGTVVVRNALFINPETAQGHVVSDPFPKILDGVPLRLRSIDVRLDRPDFTLNPTNCEPLAVEATLHSTDGASSSPTNRFQASDCDRLGFKPGLKLALKGGTKRSDNPALTATLKAPLGEANIAATTVLLPSSEFIDNANINNPCTRVQFAANACPPSSILGTAVAYTPLLEKPLEGPVYFRSNGGERELPDMVADLNGQIHVTLVGFIDAVHKKGSEESRVRTRFLSVPDAPVSKFVLSLKGGKKGLIENSKNLCAKGIGKASVQLSAQNGLTDNFDTALKTSCKKKKGKKAKHATHHSAARQALAVLPSW